MSLEPRSLSKNGGTVPCPSPCCPSPAWTLEDLAENMDKKTFLAYAAALRYMLFDAAAAKCKAEQDLADQEAAVKAAGMVRKKASIN